MFRNSSFRPSKFFLVLVLAGIVTVSAFCQDGALKERFSKNQWTQVASIPEPIFGSCAVVLDGKLHILGGGKDKGASAAHQVYDPQTDSWSLKASLPDPGGRGWGLPSVYKDRIYLFGGCDALWAGTKTAWVYEPETDKWSDITPMPVERMNGAAVTVGDCIYIFGGHTGLNNGRTGPRIYEEQLRSVFRYNPDKNTYTRQTDAPETMNFLNYYYYDGAVYVISGCEHEKYVPGYDGETYYSFGQGVLRYDIAGDSWKKISTPRLQRTWTLTQCSPMAGENGRMYIVGGRPTTLTRLYLCEYYDIENDRFVKLPDLPYTRCCGSGAVIDGVLFVTGGFFGPEGLLHQVARETLALRVAD
jgi:N-acetylneuraminic acid mutarotase